jgi:uncharacterized repeat protein (TIGR03803 family)
MNLSSGPPTLSSRFSATAMAMAVFVLGLTLVPTGWAASQFKVLYSFKGAPDGSYPSGALTFDAAGNLYGATQAGGSSGQQCAGNGCGTIFKLANSGGKWTESVLYSFCLSRDCSDGDSPNGGLTFYTDGNLYGTTPGGGGSTEQCAVGTGPGCGVAFELKNQNGKWAQEVLYRFHMNHGGAAPNGGLVFDQAGNLYGTAAAGGDCCNRFSEGAGVVFELSPGQNGWTEDVLYSFCSQADCSDGSSPYAGVVWGPDGVLYGTTAYGGAGFQGCRGGCGAVFELTPGPNGWSEEVMKALRGTDGGQSEASLAGDGKGNLYGTTWLDGAFGHGTVFRLRQQDGIWDYDVLYNFHSGEFYGSFATQPVVDKAGNLYGTMWTGGNGPCNSETCGLVYKLSRGPGDQWTYSVIYSFTGGDDGGLPSGTLVLDDKDNLYGVAEMGGTSGNGVVYQIIP